MRKKKTEDQVRDQAAKVLGFNSVTNATVGVGQLTTFNQLGFKGVSDKPDGWYLPNDYSEPAIILEAKASNISLKERQVKEILKNIQIVKMKYKKVVGILYNGDDVRVFKGEEEIETTNILQNKDHYLSLFDVHTINKEYIYELTARINNCLHFDFGIKNLYHRMIFTACALVAKRYNAHFSAGMNYETFKSSVVSTISQAIAADVKVNQKLDELVKAFNAIQMNLDVQSQDAKEQARIADLITQFILWVTTISDCINSNAWRGEDVMGIFFNEFNRYKKKSESGQIFTPEHITDFIYRILEANKDDRILDATCGSGGFLVKAMANMIQEAGGINTDKAKKIKAEQLFGIEFDREIYALACANMLIHKDGKTNLEWLDARSDVAAEWISKQNISKVLMNPPYENKYGCIPIVENVLDHVPRETRCAFIMPDKKLEKASAGQITRILKHHRLCKVIKLPTDLFFGIGVETSIFVFEAGIPQQDKPFFACYMKEDGLVTVKNKGRHDVHSKWQAIEAYWVDVVQKQSGDDTCQWNTPIVGKCLSYQVPQKPFEIFEEDFKKTALDYLMFKEGIDAKSFNEKLLTTVLYSGEVIGDTTSVKITIPKQS